MHFLFGKKFLWGLGNLIAIVVMAGCQTSFVMADSQSSPQAGANTATRQLIIKFKPDTISCNTAGIAQLSSATQVSLEYVRPMSGDACVVKLLDVDANSLREQELLRQHPAIEWLEQDEKKKAL